MSNFRTRIPKWTAVSLGDNDYDRGQGRGGGSKSSSIELLPIHSEFTREQRNSFSPVWKPAWYTGWHTGVLACAAAVVVVLLINVGLTIYAATNPEYKMEDGIGALYSGSCDKSRVIGLWLHLLINALSTLLLSGSNYTQQCLSAPTRSEINAAHVRRRWMDIGVPSIRNLFRIKVERTFLWIAIGITSIPLHLLYNSAVYTWSAAHGFIVALVSDNHFENGAYRNTAMVDNWFGEVLRNDTTGEGYWDLGYQAVLHDVQLFISILEGHKVSTPTYEDLTVSQCVKFYNTDLMSNRRNLFLMTNYTSNATNNNTPLDLFDIGTGNSVRGHWMCSQFSQAPSRCDINKLTSRVANGLPWLANIRAGEVVEITGCKSEIAEEKCKVQFSLGIMAVVICCNLVKACCMVMTVVRSREPTLVTLGDAVDSFLRIPDPTTQGICFADRRFIEKEWRRGWRTGSRQWKQKEVQRWWASVSKAAILLRFGMLHDGTVWSNDLKSMWTRGFGKVNSVSIIDIPFRNITQAILLANLPQTILSFLYLTYNSFFTCMLAGHEWSLFGHHHRPLRVTSPRPGQRSTYWLQMPYTYAIPLMTLSGLLHWLTSQSIFLARVEISNTFGRETLLMISTVGYSCIAIIFVLALGILALLSAAGMGYKQFAAEITTVGSCSAAISAACHASGADSEGIVGKKVRWGDVESVPNLRVRHLTFSSEEGVRKPAFGEVYSGAGREESDRL